MTKVVVTMHMTYLQNIKFTKNVIDKFKIQHKQVDYFWRSHNVNTFFNSFS